MSGPVRTHHRTFKLLGWWRPSERLSTARMCHRRQRSSSGFGGRNRQHPAL